jgi:hypothetical protein
MTNKPEDLDPITTERLLRGSVSAKDAPAGFENVADLASRLADRRSRVADPQRVPERLLDKMVAAREDAPRRHGKGFAAGIIAAAMVAMVLGTTGLAYANVLPDPVQRVAAVVLSQIGLTVPTPVVTGVTPSPVVDASVSPSPDSGNGSTISKLATSTPGGSVAKGATISGVASNGKSHAGQNGAASHPTPHATPAPPAPPVSTPAPPAQSGGQGGSSQGPGTHGPGTAGSSRD